jgi:16S rRNA (uracil1498-N3)-methyltransferase
LGVHEFVPLITERCNVHLDATRMAKRVMHWQSVIISACEQSERNRVPIIATPTSLEKWLLEAKHEQSLILMPKAQKQLNQLKLNSKHKTNILIGPEGGLSETELNQALAANFIPIRLGPRILRTETAGLAIISALQALYGDFC